MKNFFKNKKLWAILIPVVCVAVAAAIAVPHFIDDSVDPKSTTENEAAVNVDNKTDERIEAVENNVVEGSLETTEPTANDSFVKVFDNAVSVGEIKFSYKTSNAKDDVFGKPTKEYESQDFDIVIVGSDDNKIYKLQIGSKTNTTDFVKAENTSEAALKSAAQKTASKLCDDMKKYNECTVTNARGRYKVVFERKISGYKTSERISVNFDENLCLYSYYCNPSVFDGIDISDIKVDEKAIIAEIDEQMREHRSDAFGYTKIENIMLDVNNGKVIAKVSYTDYDKNGKIISEEIIGLYDYVIK